MSIAAGPGAMAKLSEVRSHGRPPANDYPVISSRVLLPHSKGLQSTLILINDKETRPLASVGIVSHVQAFSHGQAMSSWFTSRLPHFGRIFMLRLEIASASILKLSNPRGWIVAK